MDMFGEFADGPDLNNDDYVCIGCGTSMDSIEKEEYHAAPDELQYDLFRIIEMRENKEKSNK